MSEWKLTEIIKKYSGIIKKHKKEIGLAASIPALGGFLFSGCGSTNEYLSKNSARQSVQNELKADEIQEAVNSVAHLYSMSNEDLLTKPLAVIQKDLIKISPAYLSNNAQFNNHFLKINKAYSTREVVDMLTKKLMQRDGIDLFLGIGWESIKPIYTSHYGYKNKPRHTGNIGQTSFHRVNSVKIPINLQAKYSDARELFEEYKIGLSGAQRLELLSEANPFKVSLVGNGNWTPAYKTQSKALLEAAGHLLIVDFGQPTEKLYDTPKKIHVLEDRNSAAGLYKPGGLNYVRSSFQATDKNYNKSFSTRKTIKKTQSQ